MSDTESKAKEAVGGRSGALNGYAITSDLCNSLSGCRPPQKHCRHCSHAYFFGEVMCRGRRWNIEFNPQFGFVFNTADGRPLKVQPGEDHPVWKLAGIWLDGRMSA